MRRLAVLASVLCFPACTQRVALRYDGAASPFAPFAPFAVECAPPDANGAPLSQALVIDDSQQLVVDTPGGRELIAGPLRILHEAGALHVYERYSQRTYADADLRGVALQRPDTTATIVLVALGTAAAVAASVAFGMSLSHIGEL